VFQLGKTIVSEDIIEKDFMCILSACKSTTVFITAYIKDSI